MWWVIVTRNQVDHSHSFDAALLNSNDSIWKLKTDELTWDMITSMITLHDYFAWLTWVEMKLNVFSLVLFIFKHFEYQYFTV